MTTREALSNNHFGQDNQIVDVLKHIEKTDPGTFNAFLYEFPEWERVEGDMTKIVAEYDPEWGDWVVDWIEKVTDIYWEDGEPWMDTEEAK